MIAHIDADAFFASVLTRRDPRLKGKPLLALGMGGSCVIAATYEAKAFGVKTGMALRDALKLVPHALQIPSDFRETALASREIEGIIAETCPLFEQMSVDEWYLDLGSAPRLKPDADFLAWGRNIQAEILRRTSLSVSVGIGPTKLLAKMAGEYRKPAGVTAVKASGSLMIEEFLRDRPAAAVPGIGRRRMIRTDEHGWKTAWDFAAASPAIISKIFGKPGREMQQELLGVSVWPIVTDAPPPKSVSRARSFKRTNDRAFLWAHVLRHLEYVVLKMRRDNFACHHLSLWLRNAEYEGCGSHVSLPHAMNTEEELRPYVARCFRELFKHNVFYTQTGLVLSDFRESSAAQYSLFQNPSLRDRTEKLQEAIDALHERFGRGVLTRGAALPVASGTRPDLEFPTVE